MSGAKPCDNVTVSDNTFDTSFVSMIVMGYPNSEDDIEGREDVKQGPTVSGNTWIQGYDLHSRLAFLWRSKDTDSENIYYGAASQSEMDEKIVNIDAAARTIFYK